LTVDKSVAHRTVKVPEISNRIIRHFCPPITIEPSGQKAKPKKKEKKKMEREGGGGGSDFRA